MRDNGIKVLPPEPKNGTRQTPTKKMRFRPILSIAICVLLFSFAVSAQTKDAAWTRVVSKNFELVGNANATDIEQTAVRLEQFRQIFQKIYPQLNAQSSKTVRVVVFKSLADYKPFQPVRADGATDEKVKGYFAAGSDVNYIALPLDNAPTNFGGGTVFHEYIHFLINNNVARANIPAWLNEGLAEYYENLRMENRGKVVVGEAPPDHLRLLQTESLAPLSDFLAVNNYALHNQGNHGRSVFYVQAWAFVHFLQNAHRAELNKFLDLLIAKKPPRAAFEEAFRANLTTLENKFKVYLEKRRFETSAFDYNQANETLTEIESAPLAQAEALAISGDLLLHTNRLEEAAAQLRQALALDAGLPTANAALAMTFVRQGKITEAKQHLEKALATDTRNYLLPYYYAYALCSEDFDGTGFVRQPFAAEKTKKIRALIEKSIALNANFAANYHLLAFVNGVNGENLNEAVWLLEKAIALDSANGLYQLELAQIHVRLENYETARRIAENVFSTATEKKLRNNAHAVIISVNTIEEQLKHINEISKGEETEYPVISQEEGLMRAFNEALREPRAGEQRILGYLTKIDCDGKSGVFSIRPQTKNETLKLNVANLQGLRTVAFVADVEGKQLGCGARQPENFVVATFKKSDKFVGEVVSLEFVPENFRFIP